MKVVIIGHGGHSKVVSDNIRASKDHQIIGYLDNKYEDIQIIDHLIYGPIGSAKHLMEENNDVKFVMAIGDNKVRKSIIEMLDISIENFVTIIHPTACISPSATIGKGTVVMPQAVINADVRIGHHCIINSCSVVEHDSLLDEFVHLCPNSTIAGTVEIGKGTCVGSGATIVPSKIVGEWTIIGAGATVIDDLPDNCLAVGTPAKVKLKNKLSVG